jgi:hypothetical protein
MKNEPPPNKPPDKRGVNKATMDAPQEEFVDDQSASTKRSSQTADPSERTPQPKESGES